MSPVLIGLMVSLMLMSGAVWLTVADRRSRAFRARIDGVLEAYMPASNAPASLRTRMSGFSLVRNRRIAAALEFLRIDPVRSDLYPAPWAVVLAGLTFISIAVTGAASLLVGPLTWAALPLVWVGMVRSVFAGYGRKRANRLYEQFPDALSMVVRSIRAGLPVTEALRVVSEEGQMPTALEFGQLYNDIRLGGSLPEALMKLAVRTGLLEYRFFAVSLALQSQSGGSLTETLDNLADVIRKRVALRQRAIALSSEARMTMYVLACLPFIAGVGLLLMSPVYVTTLFTTATGRMMLFIGIGLLSMGIGSMKFLIRKAVS